jgi:hypothetical protein
MDESIHRYLCFPTGNAGGIRHLLPLCFYQALLPDKRNLDHQIANTETLAQTIFVS